MGIEDEGHDGSGPSMHCSATAVTQWNEIGNLQMYACFTTYQQNAEQCNNFFLFASLQRQEEEVFSGDLQCGPEFSSHPGSLAASQPGSDILAQTPKLSPIQIC